MVGILSNGTSILDAFAFWLSEVNRSVYFINGNSNLEIDFLKVCSAGSSVSKENIF